MKDKILCNNCKKGYIIVTKACMLKWRVKCSDCSFNMLMTYPQLLAYIKNILKKEK